MKKRIILILLVSISLVFLINFTSASWFSDTFNKITGKAVTTCTDSDGGKDYYTGGITQVGESPETMSTLYDACTGNNLGERFCNPDGTRGEETYPCPYKCEGYPSYCINDPGCGSNSLDSCESETDCTSVGGKWCSYPTNYTCQPDSCPSTSTSTTSNGSTSTTSNTSTSSTSSTTSTPSTTSTTTSSAQQGTTTTSTGTSSSGKSSYEEKIEEDNIIEEKSKFIDEKGHEVEIKIKTQTKIKEDGASIREEERRFKDKFGNEVKVNIKVEIKADGTLISDEDREFINEEGNLVKIRIKIESKDGGIRIKRVIEVEGAEIESDLEIAEEFEDGEVKLKANLSNGNKEDIKIMPDKASEIALEKLGFKGFEIELKEVGKGDNLKAVYVAEGNESGKFLGIFKVKLNLEAQIDAETGEVINFDRPWWAFLVTSAEQEPFINETNISVRQTNETNISIQQTNQSNESNNNQTQILANNINST